MMKYLMIDDDDIICFRKILIILRLVWKYTLENKDDLQWGFFTMMHRGISKVFFFFCDTANKAEVHHNVELVSFLLKSGKICKIQQDGF